MRARARAHAREGEKQGRKERDKEGGETEAERGRGELCVARLLQSATHTVSAGAVDAAEETRTRGGCAATHLLNGKEKAPPAYIYFFNSFLSPPALGVSLSLSLFLSPYHPSAFPRRHQLSSRSHPKPVRGPFMRLAVLALNELSPRVRSPAVAKVLRGQLLLARVRASFYLDAFERSRRPSRLIARELGRPHAR